MTGELLSNDDRRVKSVVDDERGVEVGERLGENQYLNYQRTRAARIAVRQGQDWYIAYLKTIVSYGRQLDGCFGFVARLRLGGFLVG